MKQLLVLSGKGGTGKTTVASALIEYSQCHAYADCDVDAPNLHIISSQMSKPEISNYYGFGKADIDKTKCINCGLCEENCRFDAIHDATVDVYACEGCGVCERICPVQAITMRDHASGSMMLYKKNTNVFSTAKLNMGSGATGKLVTAVKQRLTKEADEEPFAIIDGSPGIGCPVIASISGVHMVLVVAEPTLSGMHDMKRILSTAEHFGVKCAVCINKYDINIEHSDEIERDCKELNVPVIGKIPFDKTVLKAVNGCKSMASYPNSPAGKAIQSIWNELKNYL